MRICVTINSKKVTATAIGATMFYNHRLAKKIIDNSDNYSIIHDRDPCSCINGETGEKLRDVVD